VSRIAIAGIQMRVADDEDNIATMYARLKSLKQRFPWVTMAVFSELAALGQPHRGHSRFPGRRSSRSGTWRRRMASG
jgi:hypothetical protein